jgi:iron complex outermembrane receptor protein
VRVASGSAAADFRLVVPPLGESITVTEDLAKAVVDEQRAATPGGVTIVAGEDLHRRHTNGLADMLRYVPGVWAESASGSEELFFSSRGSNLDAVHYDKNGIKLLQDGLPVTTADGNNHNRVIDPLSARYASVARGANALTYGASTLGGAIDFASPIARNSAPASVFLSGGSHGSLDGRATVGGAGDVLDGLLTVETKQWEGYRGHSDQDRWGLYANAGWQPSDAVSVRAFATYVDNFQHLPGALTRAEAGADPGRASADAIGGDYGKQVETARVAAKTTWTLGADRLLTAGLSYEEQSLFHPIVDRIFVDFDGPGPNPPVEVFSLLVDTDHRDLGGVVRYDQSAGAHDLQAGLNYGKGSVEGGNFRNDGGRPNGISEFVDNRADSVEAFVVDRWRASARFTVVLGAQYVHAARDVRTTNADTGAVSNPEATYSSFNPRVGAVASLNDAGELYGNVSRLFEAPTTFEMEDDVRGGNATLDPMTGTVVEVGWRSRSRQGAVARWTWDIGAYYARISDEILSVDDPNAPGNSLTTNVDETVHAGIEALVGASFELGGGAHRLDPQVSVSLNQFGFDGDPVYGDNDLPASPTHVVRGEVLYRHRKGFYAGPTFDLVGERYADFANTYTVDGYALMGLRGGFSGRRWEVFGEVRNLFDEEYIAAVNVFNAADPDARALYPGAPLSAYIGWRFSFQR